MILTASQSIGNGLFPLQNLGTISLANPVTTNLIGTGVQNDGTILATGGGEIDVASIGNLTSNTLSGGNWYVGANSIIRLSGADIVTNSAKITLDGANSNLYNGPGTASALANFATNSASGVFTTLNGRSFSVGAFTNTGTLATAPAGTFSVGGALLNSGTIINGGSLTAQSLDGGGTITNNGSLLLVGTASGTQQAVLGSGITSLKGNQLAVGQFQQGTLSLNNAAKFTIYARSAGGSVGRVKGMTIDTASDLDLSDDDLLIDYSCS